MPSKFEACIKSLIDKKIMVSIFFSKAGVISLDVLNENHNANRTCYKEVCLKNLFNQWKIRHKKCGLASIVLHHDIAK